MVYNQTFQTMSDQDKTWSTYHSSDSGDAPGGDDSQVEDTNELACSMPLEQQEQQYDIDGSGSLVPTEFVRKSSDTYLYRELVNEPGKWTGSYDNLHAKDILTVRGVNVFNKLNELEEKVQAVLQVVESFDLDVSDDEESEADSESEFEDSEDESVEYDSDDSEEYDSDESEDSDSESESSEDESDEQYEIRPSFVSEANIVALVLLFIAMYVYIVQSATLA